MLLEKVFRWAKLLGSRHPSDPKATAIREELGGTVARATDGSPSIRFAVQCLPDPFYLALFGVLSIQLRAACSAIGELIVVRSISGAVGNGWVHRLARSPAIGLPLSAQWTRSFRGVVDRVGYRSLSPRNPLRDFLDWWRSFAIWRRARSATDFSALQILGVPVGDLVIDSYLRFRPSPRFDVRDPFVRRLIWQVYRDVRRARAYFRSARPKLYLTSYATYIEHGIPVRVALQEGVRVLSFGTTAYFGKELTAGDWLHTPTTGGYRRTFESLPNQRECLAEAEQRLLARFAGNIDVTTSYMKVSAYAARPGVPPDVKDAVVVFLHDFYDSPHIYDGFVFTDFWQWACFTIETLTSSRRKLFVKPHPNQVVSSEAAMRELVARYPEVSVLPANVNNAQLAEAGMLCGVTAYGTVAHELAYFGVPSIACAQHPHHAFDFCRTARSPEEYRNFLRTPEVLPAPREAMRRQALAFFYMHNLYGDDAGLALRRHFVTLWKACHDADADERAVVRAMRDLAESAALRAYVEHVTTGTEVMMRDREREPKRVAS